MTITCRAPAKINLGLRVLRLRPDGYHDIDTIMWAIAFYDELELTRTPGSVRLVCTDPELPVDHRNTAFRAAALFLDTTRIRGGVTVRLAKHIPWGTGLGGASSDAVAVLRGLDELFDARLGEDRLLALARQIGSDVPFFVRGGCARATGRGEILEPIAAPRMEVLLHVPEARVATDWAYRNLKSKLTDRGESHRILAQKLARKDFTGLQSHVINSFEELVFSLYPRLQHVKTFFLAQGARAAALSGSGSALFALTDRENIDELQAACVREQIDVIRAHTL